MLRCLSSNYGIDIHQENVTEARYRLRSVIASHFNADWNTQLPSDGLASAVDVILGTNIVRADTLTEGRKVELIAYVPGPGATFLREWSFLEEPESQLDLFGDVYGGEPRRDVLPVHYADLATHRKADLGTRGGPRVVRAQPGPSLVVAATADRLHPPAQPNPSEAVDHPLLGRP